MIGDQDIYLEVFNERIAQDEKWGEQNHPVIADRTPEQVADGHAYFQNMADRAKRVNDRSLEEGHLDWAGILLEEVYEALAETDPVKQREELVQVAAVAVAAIECLDRRAAQ